MLKFKVIFIVLSFCAAAGAGTLGNTKVLLKKGVPLLNYVPVDSSSPKLSEKQKNILADAVSSFVAEIDTGDLSSVVGASVSSEEAKVSVGFVFLKTGIRMNDEGTAFLSVEGTLKGIGIVAEVEFGSLNDLFDSVGKSLVKTAKLVPYSYSRWIEKEDIDFNDYFDVFEDQRPFTLKAIDLNGRMHTIYESRESGLETYSLSYEEPSIISFSSYSSRDAGKEDGRDEFVGDGYTSYPSPTPGDTPDPGTGPGTEPIPDPDPSSDVWNGFASYSSHFEPPGHGLDPSRPYTPETFKIMYYVNADSDDVELTRNDEGNFDGNIKMSNYTSYSPLFAWLGKCKEVDLENHSFEQYAGDYEYIKWGSWKNNIVSSPLIIGVVTPLDDVPKGGTASYVGVGGMRGRYSDVNVDSALSVPKSLLGDVNLTADFSTGTINGGFVNMVSGNTSVSDFDVDMSISESGNISGTMSGIFNGKIKGEFAGPNAEEMFGGWTVSEDGIEGAGFFAGKR